MIKITPEAQLEKEPEGFEFGYYAFDDLEPIQTSEVKDHIMAIYQKSSDDVIPDDIQIEWGLTPKHIKQVQ